MKNIIALCFFSIALLGAAEPAISAAPVPVAAPIPSAAPSISSDTSLGRCLVLSPSADSQAWIPLTAIASVVHDQAGWKVTLVHPISYKEKDALMEVSVLDGPLGESVAKCLGFTDPTAKP